MKFVNDHGVDLNSADVPQHMFQRVRFDANEHLDVCRLAQPYAGWEQLGGVWTIGYDVAVLWSSHAAWGHPDAAGKAVWQVRPDPSLMGVALAGAVAQMDPVLKAMTPGQWLAQIKVGADKVTGVNRAANHVWNAVSALDGPAVATIVLTDADGTPILDGGGDPSASRARSSGGAPAGPREQDDATGWTNGPSYVKEITWGDMYEKGTRHLGRLGLLYYALGGPIDGTAMTKIGPVGCLADRAIEVLGITQARRYVGEAAAQLAAALMSPKVSIAFFMYKPSVTLRRLDVLQRLRCEDPSAQAAQEHKLIYDCIDDCVGWWPTLQRASADAAMPQGVAENLVIMLTGAGLDPKLSFHALERLNVAVQKYDPWLSLEETKLLAPATRSERVAAKLRSETRAAGGAGAGYTHAPLELHPQQHQSTARSGGAVHRQLIADAAATDDKWVRAEATARALYRRGDYNGALQTLFTGKAVGHPNLGPSTLARMLLFGRVKTSDLPDPEHRWIDSVIPRIPEYIGSQVLHAYVADGDMRPEDQRSVPLNEFWEVCKMKGSEWPAKMDAEAYVLGKVLQAIDGTTYLNVPLSERYRDVWRSAQLARPVGAAFAALGMAKDGEGTIRHTITSSNQTVALYGKGGGAVLDALLFAQSNLIKGSFGELGEAFDLTLGNDPMAPIIQAPLRSAADSPARINWAKAREGHRDQAQKVQTGYASEGGGHVPQQLPTMATLASGGGATPSAAAFAARGGDEEAKAAAAARAAAKAVDDKADAQRRAKDQLVAAEKRGAVDKDVGGQKIVDFGWVDYSVAKLDKALPGMCPKWAIGQRRQVGTALCDGSCGLKHDFIPTAFKLNECRADSDANRSGGRGGRGGDRGGGKGKRPGDKGGRGGDKGGGKRTKGGGK